MDVALRGYVFAAPWVDAGDGLPSLSLGHYSELMMMYLLGLVPRPIPSRRNLGRMEAFAVRVHGMRYIGSFAPIFVHQYSQAWFDFRGKRDKYADYFRNSITATEVHRHFCWNDQAFSSYGENLWELALPTRQMAIGFGVGRPLPGRLMERLSQRSAGSLPFLPEKSCACCDRSRIAIQMPGADTDS